MNRLQKTTLVGSYLQILNVMVNVKTVSSLKNKMKYKKIKFIYIAKVFCTNKNLVPDC
jgi:hypothetical protein